MEARLLDDCDQWNDWVLGRRMGSLLQSYDWGEFKARFGWRPVRIAVVRDGQIAGGVQLLLRRLPLGTVAYAPRGPVVDYSDGAVVDTLLAEIHRVARAHGAIFVKIEPEVRSSPSLEAALIQRGFTIGGTVQPRSTILIDLTADLETLGNQLNGKTRYNIGLAGRRGVTVRHGSGGDVQDFYRLLQETSRRSGFPIHSLGYYQALWTTLERAGMVRILLAVHEQRPLAAAMIFLAGRRAYYLYGASSAEHRNLKPNDLLQWECIKYAKSQGCISYDLWGIPDAVGEALEQGLEPELNGSGKENGQARTMWGVYNFKRGFGGRVIRYAGAYDYVYSRPRYWLYLAGISRTRPALAWPGQTSQRQATGYIIASVD